MLDPSAGTAYGAGMSGGAFDPVAFVRQPATILRLCAAVFGLIIMGCIGGSYVKSTCLFNGASATCGFATFTGLLMVAGAVGFLIVAAKFAEISSVQMRRHVVTGELIASAATLFCSVVIFLDLAVKWGATNLAEAQPKGLGFPDAMKSPMRAAVTFALFAVPVWTGIVLFAWRKYQEGAASAFAPSDYDAEILGAGGQPKPYAGYPGGPAPGPTESYQEPPFSAPPAAEAAPKGYQEPNY